MSKNSIEKYIEPATIVTLIAAGMYLTGLNYTRSYLLQFHVDHNSLEYPPIYYLGQGFYPLLLCSIIVFFALYCAKDVPKKTVDFIKGNLLAFLLALTFMHQGFYLRNQYDNHIFLPYVILISGLLLLILSIVLTVKKLSFGYYLFNMSSSKRLLGLILLLLFCNIISSYLGNMHALKLIKGYDTNLLTVNFIFKKNQDNALQKINQYFILIKHRKGNYYVIPKTKTPNHNPVLYVIPEREISLARISKLDGEL